MARCNKTDRQQEPQPSKRGLRVFLNANNKWIRLMGKIPWSELETRYAKIFASEKTGKPAINARIALGAFIVQTLLKTTDEETVEQIEEIPYIQCFLGLEAYTTEPIIASSSLSQIRERLSEEDQQAINELLMDAIKGEENHWKTEKEEELVVEESIKREMDRLREVITERFRLWRYGPAED